MFLVATMWLFPAMDEVAGLVLVRLRLVVLRQTGTDRASAYLDGPSVTLSLVIVIPLNLNGHRGLKFDWSMNHPIAELICGISELFWFGPKEPNLLPLTERVANRPLIIVPFLVRAVEEGGAAADGHRQGTRSS